MDLLPEVLHAIRMRDLEPRTFLTGVVYFALAPHSRAVKIGFTSGDSGQRVADLQTGTPEPLEWLGDIPGSRYLEKALHLQFELTHIRGEWFGVSPEIREFYSAWIMPFDIPGEDFHPTAWNCNPWPRKAGGG